MKTKMLASLLATLLAATIAAPAHATEADECQQALAEFRAAAGNATLGLSMTEPIAEALGRAAAACESRASSGLGATRKVDLGMSVQSHFGDLVTGACKSGTEYTPNRAFVALTIVMGGDTYNFSRVNGEGWATYSASGQPWRHEFKAVAAPMYGVLAHDNRVGTIFLGPAAIKADDSGARTACVSMGEDVCAGEGWAVWDHEFYMYAWGDLNLCLD